MNKHSLMVQFENRLKNHPQGRMILSPHGDKESELNYSQYFNNLQAVMGPLSQLKAFKGRVVAIEQSDSLPHAHTLIFALLGLRALIVPVGPSWDKSLLIRTLKLSESKYFISDQLETLQQVLHHAGQLKHLKGIFAPEGIINSLKSQTQLQLIAIESLLIPDGSYGLEAWRECLLHTPKDDKAFLIFDSTTDRASLISHNALCSSLNSFYNELSLRKLPPGPALSHTDLLHPIGRMAFFWPLFQSCGLAFSHLGQHPRALNLYRPRYLFTTNSLWEELIESTLNKLESHPATGRAIKYYLENLVEQAKRVLKILDDNRAPALIHLTALKLLSLPLSSIMGSLLFPTAGTVFCEGPRLKEDYFYLSRGLGLQVLRLLGLKETAGPFCMSGETTYSPTSLGRPMEGIELKLSEQSEILLKGDFLFTRYYKGQNHSPQSHYNTEIKAKFNRHGDLVLKNQNDGEGEI